MSKLEIVKRIEASLCKKDLPDFHIGDTISVHTRIIEGDKERIQVFTGIVIARKGGNNVSETFSLRRIAYGEGMERVFPLHSPRIAKIEIVKEGHVRRSKLYYLRGTYGKAAKVKSRHTSRAKADKVNVAQESSQEVSAVANSNGSNE